MAQIDSHPAFSFKGHDLLCEPRYIESDKLILDQLCPSREQYKDRLRKLKESIVRTYCAVLEKRVCAIIKWCAEQRVDLVAFPEYSIPAGLLPRLHEQARAAEITVIAGTHHVTPRLLQQSTYAGFAHQPKVGNAVAPILGLEVPRLVSKLTCSQWETGSLQPGDLWELVPWRDGHSFAVLICLDVLHPESPQRERIITAKVMQKAAFQVVLSLTSPQSTEQFDKALAGQLKSYHRPALFVNAAPSGGSKFFVIESPGGTTSESLPPRDEAVLVWDIKLTHHALSKPTGSEFVEPAKHVATANLIESGALPGYTECLRLVEAATTIDEVTGLIGSHHKQIEHWRSQRTIPVSVKTRFGWLLDRLGDLTDVEFTKALFRNIPLPEGVPKLDELRLDSTQRALAEVRVFKEEDERSVTVLKAESSLDGLVHGLRSRDVQWSESLSQQLAEQAEQWREPPPIARPAKAKKLAHSAVVAAAADDTAPLPPQPQPEAPRVAPPEGVLADAAEERERKIELGSPPLPQDLSYRDAPRRLWALLHEQRVGHPRKAGPIDSRIRLGLARGWLLRAQCCSPEGIDILWWRDERAARERIEVIPETCERNFDARLNMQKHRLASVEKLIDWDVEPTAPKLRRDLSALLHLSAHARRLIEEFDADMQDLPRRYVSLMVRRRGDKHRAAEDELSDWWEDGVSTFFLLGEFGGGKTTTLRRFARDRAERFLVQPEAQRAPVLVDLRGAGAELDPVALARHALRPGDPGVDDLVRLALEHGLIGVLFDGFDELLRRDAAQAIAQLGHFTAWSGERRARVLISGRTRLFAAEEQEIFAADRSGWSSLIDKAVSSGASIGVLQPFDASRIKQYLDASVPEQATALERFIADTPGLLRLAEQPLLLSLIITLSEHILAGGQREVALAALYQQYIDEWLHDRSAQLSQEERERLVRGRAWEMWHRGKPVTLDTRGTEWAELRTAPFFRIGADGTLAFVHTSFLEYFVALHIVRDLEAGTHSPLPSIEISPEVATFMVGLFDSRGGTAAGLLDALTHKGHNAAERAKAVCASYLVHACRSGVGEHLRAILAAAWGDELRLDRVDLKGRRLRFASLRRAHLSGADLSICDLSGADLSDATLYQACLDDIVAPAANLQGANLAEASLDAARLRGASLVAAKLQESSMCGADLTAVTLRDAQFEKARLRGADLTGADLSGADLQGVDLSFAILQSSSVQGARFAGATWSGASLRDTDTKDIVDPPAENTLAQYPPHLPAEIYARPRHLSGARSLLGPKHPLAFVAASPSGDLIFLKSSERSAELRRTYVLDGRSGQILSCIDESITELRFSSNGAALFAICMNNIGLLLDGRGARVLCRQSLPYNERRIEFCANDSRLILLCDNDRESVVRVLDVTDGREIYALSGAVREHPYTCSLGDTRALLHSSTERVFVIDLRDGRLLLEVAGRAKWSALSANGRLAVAVPVSQTRYWSNREEPQTLNMRFYDTVTGAQLGATQLGQVMGRLEFSADGRRLVVTVAKDAEDSYSPASADVVQIYDMEEATPRLAWEHASVLSHRLSVQGDKIVFLEKDQVLSVHQLTDGRCIARSRLLNGRYGVELLDYAFDATGAALRMSVKHRQSRGDFDVSYNLRENSWSDPTEASLVGNGNPAAHAITATPFDESGRHGLEIKEGKRLKLRVLRLPDVALRQMLSNDRLLVGHVNGLVRVFALPRFDLVFEHSAQSEVRYELLPDERLLLRAIDAIEVLDLARNRVFQIPIPKHVHLARNFDWSYLAAIPDEGCLQIHALSNGERTASIPLLEPAEAQWQFIGRDRLLVVDAEKQRIRLIDVQTGQALLTAQGRQWGLSPGGDFLVLTNQIETSLYQTHEGRLVELIATRTGKYGWSSDGSWLAYPEQASLVRRNLRTEEIKKTVSSVARKVWAVSSDGERLLTESDSGELGVVVSAGDYAKLAVPDSLGSITAASFSPRDTHILLRDHSRLLVFDASDGRLLWNDRDRSMSYSRYRQRAWDDTALPSFASDGLTLVDEHGDHFALDTGAFLPEQSAGSSQRQGRFSIRDRADGAIVIRTYSRQEAPGEVALYPSGTMPYAVSASGYLSFPEQWQERWPDAIFDLVAPNGRYPLATVAAELCRPDLVAHELAPHDSDDQLLVSES